MPATTLVVRGAFRLGSSTFADVTAVGLAGLKPPAAVMNWFRSPRSPARSDRRSDRPSGRSPIRPSSSGSSTPTVPVFELTGVAAEARPRHGLARLVERVGDAGARREVVPGERRLVAGERRRRARRSGTPGSPAVVARQRLAALAVEAQPEIDRHAVRARSCRRRRSRGSRRGCRRSPGGTPAPAGWSASSRSRGCMLPGQACRRPRRSCGSRRRT